MDSRNEQVHKFYSDHVGCNTVLEDERWVPTFPNARYLMPKENYDFRKHLIESGVGAPDGGSFADSVLPVVQAGMVNKQGNCWGERREC